MSSGADIRDIDALSDLRSAFGRFGEDVSRILPAIQKELEQIIGWLDEREMHWEQEVETAQDHLYEARRDLRRCESSGDDEETPDCSFEEEQVADAERHLAECEGGLETVKQWRHRIEGQIADFQNDMHRLSHLASGQTGAAQAFLQNKIEILGRYAGSGSGGAAAALQVSAKNATIGGGSSKKFAPLAFATIDDALQWANENMHPDNAYLSDEEREAFGDYQLGSKELNDALWQGLPLSPSQKEQVFHLDAALAHNTTPTALKIWHGGKSEDWQEIKQGQTIRLDAFLSTSLAEELKDFREGGTWIEIVAPKGTHAIFMDNVADLPPDENYEAEVEILLARGTRLRIDSKETVGSELYIKGEIIL